MNENELTKLMLQPTDLNISNVNGNTTQAHMSVGRFIRSINIIIFFLHNTDISNQPDEYKRIGSASLADRTRLPKQHGRNIRATVQIRQVMKWEQRAMSWSPDLERETCKHLINLVLPSQLNLTREFSPKRIVEMRSM